MSSTFYKETDDILERYELACERISTIKEDKDLPENLQAFFNQATDFIQTIVPVMNKATANEIADRSLEECERDAESIFSIYKEERYSSSFLCPTYAVEQLGEELGGVLSSVFYRLTNMIHVAFAGRLDIFTIYMELFLQVYGEC